MPTSFAIYGTPILHYLSHRATQLVSVGQEVMHTDDAIQESLHLCPVHADEDWDDSQRLALLRLCQLARELIGRSVKVAEAAASGRSVISYASHNPQALAYGELTQEVDAWLASARR